jgi:hypothetical protein
MSDIVITVDTSSLPAANKRSSTDFDLVLSNPIRLEGVQYNLLLLKLDTFYAINNIDSQQYGNHAFTVRALDGATDITTTMPVVVPNGIYNFEDWEAVVRPQITAIVSSNVQFSVNRNTGKFLMTLVPPGTGGSTISVDLPTNLSIMLGFTDKNSVVQPWQQNTTIITTTVSSAIAFSSQFVPQWNVGILSLNLECSLTSNSVSNGVNRAVIASFNPRTVPFGAINYEPLNPVHMQINKNTIDRIRFRLTDQSGNVLKLDEDISLLMVIRGFGYY